MISHSEPDRSPVSVGITRDELVVCPPDLRLTSGQVVALEIAGVPEWAAELLLREWVVMACAESDLRLLTTWRKWAARHVLLTWREPTRRPRRPEEAPTPEDRARRRAELLAAHKRAEDEYLAYVAECGRPTAEQVRSLELAGVLIPGGAARGGGQDASGPGGGYGTTPPTPDALQRQLAALAAIDQEGT